MASGKLGQSLSAREVLELVRDPLQAVEREIGLESMAAVDVVTAISHYLNANGGKRLRPTILLLSAGLSGSIGQTAIRLAAVVEMIHTATLVHDDIIDDAETRRGKPSANVLWGNHTSVLAGDWLYMQAFQIALRQRNFQILDILISLTQRMVEGELLQLERIGRVEISEADYMELVDRKTASLFAACAELGAIAAGASDENARRLADFGWNLGMAFQLIDDILDFTAHEMVLGKPVCSDLREGKVTLPVIYALPFASSQERRQIEEIVTRHVPQALPEILSLLERSGAIGRARERAEEFASRARSLILGFPDSSYQRALLAVSELVTMRDH